MTRPIAALRSPTLMSILANFSFWLQADIQSPKIDFRFTPNFGHSDASVRFSPDYVRLSPNRRHSLADVRFRADFVCFTSRSRPSWWCRRRSGRRQCGRC